MEQATKARQDMSLLVMSWWHRDNVCLQIWDLSAGKVITDFKSHTGAVTSVQFHPKDFLLASASSDRTTKFWDLERFTLVSETAPEANGIRCIRFHPEGEAIFSGAQDSLRVREERREERGRKGGGEGGEGRVEGYRQSYERHWDEVIEGKRGGGQRCLLCWEEYSFLIGSKESDSVCCMSSGVWLGAGGDPWQPANSLGQSGGHGNLWRAAGTLSSCQHNL